MLVPGKLGFFWSGWLYTQINTAASLLSWKRRFQINNCNYNGSQGVLGLEVSFD
jgi:hypothetical protein